MIQSQTNRNLCSVVNTSAQNALLSIIHRILDICMVSNIRGQGCESYQKTKIETWVTGESSGPWQPTSDNQPSHHNLRLYRLDEGCPTVRRFRFLQTSVIDGHFKWIRWSTFYKRIVASLWNERTVSFSMKFRLIISVWFQLDSTKSSVILNSLFPIMGGLSNQIRPMNIILLCFYHCDNS